MIGLIIYCAFCYLAELGICVGSGNNAYLSLILAPIILPLELGVILGKNFIK